MNRQFSFLTAVSTASLIFLSCGAVLAVVGIFNGVLWSFAALSAFGVSMTLVAGIRAVVRLLQSLKGPGDAEAEHDHKGSAFGQYLRAMGILSIFLAHLTI